jgi:hypothetical protein
MVTLREALSVVHSETVDSETDPELCHPTLQAFSVAGGCILTMNSVATLMTSHNAAGI